VVAVSRVGRVGAQPCGGEGRKGAKLNQECGASNADSTRRRYCGERADASLWLNQREPRCCQVDCDDGAPCNSNYGSHSEAGDTGHRQEVDRRVTRAENCVATVEYETPEVVLVAHEGIGLSAHMKTSGELRHNQEAAEVQAMAKMDPRRGASALERHTTLSVSSLHLRAITFRRACAC
jgi:hypothetical protein